MTGPRPPFRGAGRPLGRRAFLRRACACAAASLAAGTLAGIEPFRRAGPPRFACSLVAYSFRSRFAASAGGPRFTLFDFVDFAAEQGFSGVELTGYYFPSPLPADYVARLRRHVYLRGLAVSGTAIGATLGLPSGPKLDAQKAAVKAWVDVAAGLGAPYIRVFANGGRLMQVPGAVEGAIAAFDECADFAGQRGIMLGLENDGGILPDTVLAIARSVKSRWFGLNLDLGNYHTADVYGDVERCAPYAINVHWKTVVKQADGATRPADIPRFLDILRRAGYEGWLGFEYEGTEDPRQAVPPWLARTRQALASA